MSTCLNPGQQHHSVGNDPTKRLCPEPGCGFLFEGGHIKQWRIVSLLKHNRIMDLYMARPADTQDFQGTNVAVRVLRSTYPELFSRLGWLARLHHAHIHPLLAIEGLELGGPLILLAPFETLGSLAPMLAGHTALSFTSIASILSQLAEALSLAHTYQIVHGHLKPENCLLAAPGTLQVDDFYATFAGSALEEALTSCTAPEQIQGRTQPASDQYALAMLAYLLLRQCSPLAHEGLAGQAGMLYGIGPRPLLAPSHPLDLALRRALSQEPTERFPNVRSFVFPLCALIRQMEETSPLSPRGDVYAPQIRGDPFSAAPYQKSAFSQAQQRNAPADIPGNIAQVGLLPGHTAMISTLSWEKRSHLLASGSEDGEIRIWAFQGHLGQLNSLLQGHKGKVRALCWSPDGLTLASASSDSAIRLWQTASPVSGQRTLEHSWWGHDGETTVLSWSLDGHILASGGKDGTLRCWSRQGELLHKQPVHSGRGGVKSLAWSPDNTWIATGGTDQSICLWNAETRQRVNDWRAHHDEVRQLQWIPNSPLLASAGGKKDTRICLWEIPTGRCLATVAKHQTEIVGLSWSSAFSCLVSCSAEGALYLWRIGQSLEQSSVLLQPGAPLDLQERPQSMLCHPEKNMLAIATKTLSIMLFALEDPRR